jgi:hypothetical protein
MLEDMWRILSTQAASLVAASLDGLKLGAKHEKGVSRTCGTKFKTKRSGLTGFSKILEIA